MAVLALSRDPDETSTDLLGQSVFDGVLYERLQEHRRDRYLTDLVRHLDVKPQPIVDRSASISR